MDNVLNFINITNDGLVISVKLVPNSSVNKLVDSTDEYIRIKISAPPIENKANKELISFLSDILDINKSKIKIISGEKSKLKKVFIAETKIENISQKIMFMLESENRI